MKTGKIWGDTEDLFTSPSVEVHRINTKAGFRCSLHSHRHRWNGFYVISGIIEIHVEKQYGLTDVTVLKAGDFTAVPPNEVHCFVCTEDAQALEIYWPQHMESTDIVRKDVGGFIAALAAQGNSDAS